MASTARELKQAFVLGPEMAKRIALLLEDKFGPVEIEARCADGVRREFKDIHDFVAYHNVREREIRRVTFEAHAPKDWHEKASVSFEPDGSSPISVSISSHSDQIVVAVREELLTLLRELRPWFALAASADLILILLGLLGAAVVFSMIALSFGLLPSRPETKATDDARSQATFGLLLLALFGGGWVLDKFRALLFPMGTFTIGEGLQRHNTMETARWAIAVGLLVSIAGSILYAAIF